MTDSKFDSTPYRKAYEAMITPLTLKRTCSLLGAASGRLNDPELRKVLKSYIEIIGFSDDLNSAN